MNKWLTVDNIKFILYIITMVVGMTLAWATVNTDLALMKKDIDVINNNHLTHIQADIAELKTDLKELKVDLKELNTLILKTHGT